MFRISCAKRFLPPSERSRNIIMAQCDVSNYRRFKNERRGNVSIELHDLFEEKWNNKKKYELVKNFCRHVWMSTAPEHFRSRRLCSFFQKHLVSKVSTLIWTIYETRNIYLVYWKLFESKSARIIILCGFKDDDGSSRVSDHNLLELKVAKLIRFRNLIIA